MARPSHLTSSDLRLLAAVERDNVRKLDAIIDLADSVVEAAEAAGVEPDLEALDAIIDGDDDVLGDTQRLDEILRRLPGPARSHRPRRSPGAGAGGRHGHGG